MLFLLRKIRRKLMQNNKITSYLLYAIGEIILVVIGILIAVSINNWNQEITTKQKEVQYLKNIRLDLKKDLNSLDSLTRFRQGKAASCRSLIEHIDGTPIEDLTDAALDVSNSIWEQHFIPNNTTFTELANSGNLSLISNDTIKELLLELEALYNENESSIEHETFDYREYISKPITRHVRLDLFTRVFIGGTTAQEQGITPTEMNRLLQDLQYRNGLHIIAFMSDYYGSLYSKIEKKTNEVISLIEQHVSK